LILSLRVCSIKATTTFIGLREIDRPHCAKGRLCSPEWLNVEKRAAEW
jgi:hypothetical protein